MLQSTQILDIAIKALEDLKAVDTVSIHVTELTSVTDDMVITTGTSSQHVKAIANNLRVEAKKAGVAIFGMEGEDNGQWILADLGDVVVHIMQQETREYYQLEKLWSVTESK